MNARHFGIFLVWSLSFAGVVGFLLFLFTFGDCFQDVNCKLATNRAGFAILGLGFVIYWTVSLLLIRRWTR